MHIHGYSGIISCQVKRAMKNLKRNLHKYATEIYFLALSLIIFVPLLRPGYVLTLDLIFTPRMHYQYTNSHGLYSETARDAVLNLLARIVDASVIEKLLLMLLFFCIGYFMYRFLLQLRKRNRSYAIVAATLYMWNPFTYSRLLAGHWAFLCGYALLPVFMWGLHHFYRQKKISNRLLIACSVSWFVASLVSVHFLLLFAVPFAVYTVLHMFTYVRWDRTAARAVALLAFITLFSLSWIVPSLLISDVSRLGPLHLIFFAPTPDLQYGLTFNLLSMYGFWAESTIGTMPKELITVWPLLTLVLLIIVAAPLIRAGGDLLAIKKNKSYSRTQRLLIGSLFITGLLGLVLAHGSTGFMQPVWDYLYNTVPVLQPFREVQKFLLLYVFAATVLFYYGLDAVADLIREGVRSVRSRFTIDAERITAFSGLILVILITPLLGFAAAGQLQTTQYPRSWYQLEEELTERATEGRILVLPWRAYAEFPFSSRQIADPSRSFFSGYVISERVPAYLRSTIECEIEFTEIHRNEVIRLCLGSDSDKQDWISQVKLNSIDYVVFNKVQAFKVNDFFNDEEHFQLIYSDNYADIYRVL
ncbi:MAG: hypothetical protein TR69_WS6001000815 [candidate division WS6 bacterium OLB20]|uniref:Glycosyltransferase RgtA/B/C/D-like domain-containing protein n=1 Tax=candidate division WS6 bacterium OLB20 TaxID=1617426 RepID=A0A136LYP3_9BACT|nr:MAG: hypothetical protein TR69_WS6001000815 [candidate division WS6 bacterium OLB20]